VADRAEFEAYFMERAEEALALINGAPELAVGGTVVDLPSTLNDLVTFMRRFVSISDAQARVVVLWIAHTHAFAAADTTPYLAITSAEKGSGKTRLLEVLEPLVAKPWFTGRVTAAVLVRRIDKLSPTLLLDEVDAAFNGDREYAETLRAVLNTGHRHGGKASCCVGRGANIDFRDFSTFSPKAIAGIGRLPDTVGDRSIPVRLKRALPGTVKNFRRREVQAEADRLRAELEAWALANVDRLRDRRPALPPELTDRQQDGAEPLLAIADAAGGDWADSARQALVELCAEGRSADDSIGKRLLSDIRDIFKERGVVERIASVDLAGALAQVETSAWGEWTNGKPITTNRLARLLRPFGIEPRKVREGPGTFRGYYVEAFLDSFARYLPPEEAPEAPIPPSQPEQVEQANVYAGPGHFSKWNREGSVPVAKSASSPIKTRVVPVVPVAEPPYGGGEGVLGDSDQSAEGEL